MPVTVQQTQQRLLGLPPVARQALFARQQGKAILITTSERLEILTETGVFGTLSSTNPFLSDWFEKREHVIVSIDHALRSFPQDLSHYAWQLELGQDYPREEILERLIMFGYERDNIPGFSVQGDTISIFKEDEHDELRLSFFGDELDAIQHNDRDLKRVRLSPLSTAEVDEDAWQSRLIEHLEGSFFLDVPELYEGNVKTSDVSWLWDFLQDKDVTSFGRDGLNLDEVEAPLLGLDYYRGKLKDFSNDCEYWLKQGYSVSLLLKYERTGRYLRERVLEQLETVWRQGVSSQAGVLGLSLGGSSRGGYRDEHNKEIVLTEDLLYGYQGTRKLRRLAGRSVRDATQLTVGDYLIHPDHGVGQFQGLEPRQVLGVTRDYLILDYAGEGRLYLPVEQLPLVRRHPGTTDDPPRLSTLGTNEWARAREKARVNAQEMALKLIKTYAERQTAQGVSLAALPEWDSKMDEHCPFELTVDQANAVDEVLADMAKEIPMDRLVSGDVGFGKTEVAIRAAHRAVGHKKQVALLVPTTVLAHQHWDTFMERFKNLPVKVEVLSRFISDRDVRDIHKGLKDGSIDIIIGTHRLLSDGIIFKDLGLLIIDEEHRFGVGQKERIKSLKVDVDVLSLSATPIPRTLYMSLVGLRDVSQIRTPPEGRKPIKTVLQPYDPMVVREAIMFEMNRGGKVFYIHDRIGSMGQRAQYLERLVPEARIGVAHGQMSSEELEDVMIGFDEGAFDLLLSTTIVESGLDIAEANTLLIERADHLGLAQLYQLRGRVGRRQTEAWAYLFYPGKLTEQAQRRLYAIAELDDLGSGHLLAEKDMEIRGVGNLLGPEQHGHIAAVSIEVYTELLAEEIAKLKGEKHETPHNVSIDLSLDARLSPSYIADDDARIGYYGRLSETRSLAEISRVRNELRGNYGPIPEEVRHFIELAKLRLLAQEKGLMVIKEQLTDIQLIFKQDTLDYDARGLKNLPYSVEVVQYPPSFSLKRRGLDKDKVIEAITQILYQCA